MLQNMVSVASLTGWKHIPCFAHTLNILVKAALSADPVMGVLKEKFKSIVTFFHKSTKASYKLKEVQKQIGNSKVKLVQEVKTLWNVSIYTTTELSAESHVSLSKIIRIGWSFIAASDTQQR